MVNFTCKQPGQLESAQIMWEHGTMQSVFDTWQQLCWSRKHSCCFATRTMLHARVETLHKYGHAQRRVIWFLSDANGARRAVRAWQQRAFLALIEEYRLGAVSYTHLTLPTKRIV
eukprot:TRINITY_DN47589_c0_g1_i1.p1 TRINITY_DN47589_c0_g1~~TRINITY_DN47589_c0_g1_i1.p1  ORF type:complete len:115 (+),score=11.88 TRINITY_DN47589_c0_g1_i1:2-346(+)